MVCKGSERNVSAKTLGSSGLTTWRHPHNACDSIAHRDGCSQRNPSPSNNPQGRCVAAHTIRSRRRYIATVFLSSLPAKRPKPRSKYAHSLTNSSARIARLHRSTFQSHLRSISRRLPSSAMLIPHLTRSPSINMTLRLFSPVSIIWALSYLLFPAMFGLVMIIGDDVGVDNVGDRLSPFFPKCLCQAMSLRFFGCHIYPSLSG